MPKKSYYFYYRLLIDLYGNIESSFYCENRYLINIYVKSFKSN